MTTGYTKAGADAKFLGVPSVLYSGRPAARFYHQERLWILGGSTAMGSASGSAPMCGSFTAKATTVKLDIALGQVWAQGAAWPTFGLVTGVQSGGPAPNTPLWQQSTSQIYTAASGVTEFNLEWFGGINGESIGSVAGHVVLTGLTPGHVYTWQVVPAMVGSADTLTSATNFGGATLPTVPGLSPDGTTLWVPFQSGVVYPVSVGGMPNWKLLGGLKDVAGNPMNWYPVVGSAITMPGSSPTPYACVVSPDGTTVAVCNYGTNTITFINASTKAIIGTSAALAGSQHTFGGAWSADSTVFWAGQSNGKVFPVTASSQAVGTAVTIGSAAVTIAFNAAGTAGFALEGANIYPLTSVTDSTMTVGSATVLTGVSGANNLVIDPRDGTAWVSASGKLYHVGTSGTIVASNGSTGYANTAIAISADGLIIWAVCGTNSNAKVAFDTATLQVILVEPGASSHNYFGIAINSVGYVWMTDIGRNEVYTFPGGQVDVCVTGDVPFVGNCRVTAIGA